MNELFYQPLDGLAERSAHARPCPELSDEHFLRLGVQRVLEAVESGRAFLQEHGPRFASAPNHHSYFAALRSARRCALVTDVSLALLPQANIRLHDRLEAIPELATYECFAVDGHWHNHGELATTPWPAMPSANAHPSSFSETRGNGNSRRPTG